MTVPTALATLVLARVAGKLADRVHPRIVAVPGLAVAALSIVLWSLLMSPDIAIGWLLLPPLLLGIGSAFIWAPLASTATRNLPMNAAGAGAGIYNTTRQVGGVLGSAAIATVIVNRIVANIGAAGSAPQGESTSIVLPEPLQEGFTTAMAQTLIVPAVVLFLGAVIALFLVKPRHLEQPAADAAATEAAGEVATPA